MILWIISNIDWIGLEYDYGVWNGIVTSSHFGRYLRCLADAISNSANILIEYSFCLWVIVWLQIVITMRREGCKIAFKLILWGYKSIVEFSLSIPHVVGYVVFLLCTVQNLSKWSNPCFFSGCKLVPPLIACDSYIAERNMYSYNEYDQLQAPQNNNAGT